MVEIASMIEWHTDLVKIPKYWDLLANERLRFFLIPVNEQNVSCKDDITGGFAFKVSKTFTS